MIIEIEYPITTTGKPARSNKSKTVVFKDAISFDFPEYGVSEAPVALLVHGPEGFRPTEYYGIEGKLYCDNRDRVKKSGRHDFVVGLRGSADVLTRHLEAELLDLGQKLRTRNSTAVATELYPPELAEHFARGMSHRRVDATRPDTEVRLPSIGDIDVKELDLAPVERQKEAFLAHLSELVIVDGVFLRETPEPLYSVSVGYPDHTTGVGSDGTAPAIHIVKPQRHGQVHTGQNTNVIGYFPADRLAEARDYALLMKSSQTGKRFEVEMPREIQVLDPSYLGFDAERQSLLVMAEHMVANGMANIFNRRVNEISMAAVRAGLDNVTPDTLLSWKRLSNAMKDRDHEELGIAVRECLEPHDENGNKVFVTFPYTVEMYEHALRKWDNRDVSFAFGKVQAPSRQPR